MELRNGKIGPNVFDRSVKKRIEHMETAYDSSVLEQMAVTSDPITLRTSLGGILSVYAAVNDLSAAGAVPEIYSPVLLLPPGSAEQTLRDLSDQISETARKVNVLVSGGHTEVTSAVTRPVVIGTAAGRRRPGTETGPRSWRPGAAVIMTKWIGLEGTWLLSREKRDFLEERFPAAMLERTCAYDRWLSTVPESAAALRSGPCLLHDVSEGGIFAALWTLAQMTGTGLEIDLKSIPVRQETIEYTDCFQINPYQMESGGALLIVTDRPEDVLREMAADGIPAARIGRLTAGNDKIIRNREEIRYLDLPQPDALLQVLG